MWPAWNNSGRDDSPTREPGATPFTAGEVYGGREYPSLERDESFLARITGRNGNDYAWNMVEQDEDGAPIDLGAPAAGDTTNFPAREANLFIHVPTDGSVIARLRRSFGGNYLVFHYPQWFTFIDKCIAGEIVRLKQWPDGVREFYEATGICCDDTCGEGSGSGGCCALPSAICVTIALGQFSGPDTCNIAGRKVVCNLSGARPPVASYGGVLDYVDANDYFAIEFDTIEGSCGWSITLLRVHSDGHGGYLYDCLCTGGAREDCSSGTFTLTGGAHQGGNPETSYSITAIDLAAVANCDDPGSGSGSGSGGSDCTVPPTSANLAATISAKTGDLTCLPDSTGLSHVSGAMWQSHDTGCCPGNLSRIFVLFSAGNAYIALEGGTSTFQGTCTGHNQWTFNLSYSGGGACGYNGTATIVVTY